MTKRIQISASPREKFTVDLVGKEYIAEPPKGSLGILLGKQVKEADNDPEKLWEMLMGYLKMVFGAKQSGAIEKRMMDPKDDLDIPHIMQLIQALTEVSTGDPTT